MNPIKLEIFLDDKTLAGMKSVEGNIVAMESATSQMIDHLKLQLKDLKKQYKALQGQGLAGDRELADIQAMQGAIGGLKDQLKELQKAKQQTNETSVIGDDPAPKLNSVKMSMAQIARELPSIAMGPQMFFLAISNNIPMFTDAIGNARKEYERLTAAGQKATPVWKQVLSSLFSWQTLMATAITLSVVYGKEIGNFFSTLFSGEKAVTGLAEAQEELNKTMMSSDTGIGKNLVSLKMLQEKWSSLGNDLAAKKKFIRENKDEFDKLNVAVTDVSDAENLLVGNTEAFIKSMQLRAKGVAAQKMAAEKYEESLKLQLEIEKEKKRPVSNLEKVAGSINTVQSRGLVNETGEDLKRYGVEYLKKQKKAVDDAAEAFFQLGVEAENEAQKELKAANIKEKTKVKPPKKGGKTLTDYENELADARIRAQQKIEATRIAIMAEGYQKRKAIANQEYKKSLAAIDKEERDTLAKLEKSKKAGKKVTPEEEQQVKDSAISQRTLAQVQYLQNSYNIEKEWRDKNQQAWIDYNKGYGTYQEKRLAITQDYALKIGKAETEGEKASLKKQRDNNLKELDFGEFKKSIDFAEVFGNLDEQSTDALSALRDKLKKYINGAAKTLKPTDLKELQDAVSNIDLKLKDRDSFKELKKSLKDYRQAEDAVTKAQEELNIVMKEGEVVTGVYEDGTGKLVKKLLTQTEAEKNLTDAQQKRRENQTKLAQSMISVADDMSSYGQAADDVVNMLEGFGVSVDENVKRVLDGFNNMAGGIKQFAQSLMAGDIGGMLSGVVNTVGGFINTIGSIFGADWGGERSEKRYRQAKDKYEKYMEVLDKVINKQKELVASMESDDFANADNSYKKAEELLSRQQDYAREMGKAYLNSGASNGFVGIGSKASRGVKQRKSISSSGWKQAKEVLGSDYSKVAGGRMTGLFDLSYEKLVKLRDEASGFWSELHEDTQNYLEKIIESEEAWQEVQEARKEALTKTDFDSFYNSFISLLSDMDSTSEDFADSFEKYLQNAIFSSLVATKYKDKIQALYESWANKAETNGLSSTEADDLRTDYQKIMDDMLKQRDQLMKDFGWTASSDETSTQSGRNGSFTTMSQEQGTKLEGLFTSLQDHAGGMHKLLEDLKKGREADHEIFMQIAENTAYCKYLETINEIMEYFKINGMKIGG